MGTSLTNVTSRITKFRVSPDSGHRQEFYVEQPRAVIMAPGPDPAPSRHANLR